jgi:hypothetical protein
MGVRFPSPALLVTHRPAAAPFFDERIGFEVVEYRRSLA